MLPITGLKAGKLIGAITDFLLSKLYGFSSPVAFINLKRLSIVYSSGRQTEGRGPNVGLHPKYNGPHIVTCNQANVG